MADEVCDNGRVSPFVGYVRSHPRLKELLRAPLERLGFGTTDWVREVMYEQCFAYLERLNPATRHALEISAGNQWRHRFNFRSFTETQYPDFDICSDVLPRRFDLIIADQVFEHLPYPHRAAKNVHDMLTPGGVFIVASPFLVRVHNVPIDCNRWTETGMSYLLQDAGFLPDHIETHSWGNRACVVGNFKRWSKRGFFGSRRNEPNFPVMVWAYARRASESTDEAS